MSSHSKGDERKIGEREKEQKKKKREKRKKQNKQNTLDTHPLHDVNVLEASDNLVLDPEKDLEPVVNTLLDGEDPALGGLDLL